jgi:integrase
VHTSSAIAWETWSGTEHRVRLYALRHTMASFVLHETNDLKLVAARLGHASELLVLKTYVHLLAGVDREAADRLGQVVRRKAQG